MAVPSGALISDSPTKPCCKCDVCDVTVPFTPSPYVTHRHNNVNPPRSVTSFMDDPYGKINSELASHMERSVCTFPIATG